MERKRKRDAEHFRLVVCSDDVQPVEVDLRVLKPSGCLLFKMLTKDAPALEVAGQYAWACPHMTRQTLLSFYKSIYYGVVTVGKNVSYQELSQAMDYEGVCVGGGFMGKAPSGPLREKPEQTTVSLARACDAIAHAITKWPRLETALDSALTQWNGASSPTRAWVRFSAKPSVVAERGDQLVALIRRNPVWLTTFLNAMGHYHYNLVRSGAVDWSNRTLSAYTKLTELLESSQSGPWITVEADKNTKRSKILHAERFANEIKTNVLEANPTCEEERDKLKFARACVAFAQQTLLTAPALGSLFDASFLDDSQRSPERTALAKALKAAGIQVVRWDDNPSGKALVFPPGWGGACGPAVLLDFTNVR